MDSEYWCHHCNQIVEVAGTGDDIRCSRCNGGCVEQIEGSPRPQRAASPFADRSRFVALLSSSPGSGRRGREEDQENGHGRSRVLVVGRPPVIELLQVLGSAMAGLEISGEESESQQEGNGSSGGVVVVDPSGVPLMVLHGGGAAAGSGGNLPGASLGDYFIGPGLEALIQRLAENDPNRYGTPPASKAAVEALLVVTIAEEHLRHDSSSECVVCKEDFEVGEETRQLPCKHLFHHDCIMPWLKMHSSCPVCRYQMATEDEAGGCGGSSQSEESTSAGENGRNSGQGNASSNRSSPMFALMRNFLSSALGNGNNNTNSNANEEDQGP